MYNNNSDKNRNDSVGMVQFSPDTRMSTDSQSGLMPTTVEERYRKHNLSLDEDVVSIGYLLLPPHYMWHTDS